MTRRQGDEKMCSIRKGTRGVKTSPERLRGPLAQPCGAVIALFCFILLQSLSSFYKLYTIRQHAREAALTERVSLTGRGAGAESSLQMGPASWSSHWSSSTSSTQRISLISLFSYSPQSREGGKKMKRTCDDPEEIYGLWWFHLIVAVATLRTIGFQKSSLVQIGGIGF